MTLKYSLLILLLTSLMILTYSFSLSDLFPNRKHEHNWTIKCSKNDL